MGPGIRTQAPPNRDGTGSPNLSRALVLVGPGRLELVEREIPLPGPGDALVRTAFVGLCRTDIELIRGGNGRVRFPHVPGHEWSGVVQSVGSSADSDWVSLALASAGRVALAPLISLDYPIEDWRTAITLVAS